VVARIAAPRGDAPVLVQVKRDDLTAGSAGLYGGNKVRKLEFLLADAQRLGAKRIVTAGAFGSHHALATTAYARQLGFDVTAVVFPQRITPHVRSVLLGMAALGAELQFTRRMEFVPVAIRRAQRRHGAGVYVIPPGGSDALGTLGYVACGLELARQWHDGVAPRPDCIHVAAGTLGTAAGLALGLALAGERIEIAATRITSRIVTNERALVALVRSASRLLHAAGATIPSERDVLARVTFVHDQIGNGYGRATPAGDDAAARFAEAGLVLDATYTAKAAASLLADPRTGEGRTLFLHTLSAVDPAGTTDAVQTRTAADSAQSLSARVPPQIAAYLTQET
jgi:1-aminocyclopropane-1-carboxylate deaminase/D-cysteine desulfhydrase-like pyridoxal-dependent ACC family enzyme